MKCVLLLIAVTGLTADAEPIYRQASNLLQKKGIPVTYNQQKHPRQFYFTSIGIPLAKAIYKAEMAMKLKADRGELNNRIIGGATIPAGISPYVGGIDVTLENGESSVCGSSLLTHTCSLTAAHCWKDGDKHAQKFVLVHGSPTLYYGGLRTETTNVTVHEDYDPTTHKCDIAMIYHAFIKFTDLISSIRLPSDDILTQTFSDLPAQTEGYGRNETFADYTKDQPLKLVNVTVMKNEDCAKFFAKGVIDDSMICTPNGPSNAEVGTCYGDSGGPLSTIINTVRYLIGVTSFGEVICEIKPSIYSRVTYHIKWIQSKIDNQTKQEN